MTLKSGSIIRVNEFLSVDDYIESPNRLYFAIMQSDGNFVVYRGALWAPNKYGPPGKIFATLQDDGNFVVYQGTPPSDIQGVWWPTNVYDPVVDCEISSIDYDVNAAKVLRSGPAELYRQEVHNDTMQTQTSSISGSESVSETSGWSDSLAIKAGASTTFKTGIPFIAEGKVKVSLEVTNTYTWNGSNTRTKTWGFNTPVSVPPHTVIVSLVSATISTIAVPYTLKGTVIFKSGTRTPGQVRGVYTGTNSHDLTVTFIQRDPVTSNILSSTQALKATSS